MTEEDANDLRELGRELAGAVQSPWEPRAVARCFARPRAAAAEAFTFTMQAWIELEAVQSPFLLGQLPEAEDAIADFTAAFAAFGFEGTTPEACEPDELILLGRRIISQIAAGFAMRLNLEPPGERSIFDEPQGGLGAWLPIYACLVSQIGLDPMVARATPVGEAFALIAGHRVNQGWKVTGETYRTLEVGERKAETGEEESDG